MGELKKGSAQNKCEDYIYHIRNLKRKARENFEEMDFANAIQRVHMEENVEQMEGEYDRLIRKLQDMTFE